MPANWLIRAVAGWVTLPGPRSSYLVNGSLNFGKALQDCTAAADATVYFPSFLGINLMFNGDLDGYAWGGSSTLTRDGVTKTYSVTWLPPWGYENQGVLAHGFFQVYESLDELSGFATRARLRHPCRAMRGRWYTGRPR